MCMNCCEHKHASKKDVTSSHNGHHAESGAHEHEHGSPGMSHGSAKDFLRRFWIVTFLLIPLALTNTAVADFLHIPLFGLNKWIQFGIATVIFSFSLVFFRHAVHEIKARAYGMMTLVSLAVGSGYMFSAVGTFVPAISVEFYLEIATLIWVLLFGHFLEARSSSVAGDALSEVAKLLPQTAHRISGEKEEDVPVSSLAEGDTVRVKPGERIPADGRILEGASHVDESLVSGESKPLEKTKGANVVSGSIAISGSLTIQLTRVGEHSTVGQIQKLVAAAQKTKPRSQRIADRASAVLTFVAGITALLVLLVWSLIIGEPFVFAVTLAITVLVIACPHALGLAIPTVTTTATFLAVKNGIFIKNLAKIETIKKANYVLFDKTGTLTRGEFGVADIVSLSGTTKDAVLEIAASLGRHSSHVIDRSIVSHAQKSNLSLLAVRDFKNIAGRGIRGRIGNEEYFLGNSAYMMELHIDMREASAASKQLIDSGKTAIVLADAKKAFGVIALADEIKPESRAAVLKLHALGVKVAMLTGDNEMVAGGVAHELGIDTYFAKVLPEDKYRYVKKLQAEGNTVLMVGDGVNDAPALTQSDAGIAIGAGTDVAVEAGDVVLLRSNPEDVVRLVILSRMVYRKMIQNLVWALGYNTVAIPAAAGVFAAWGFYLRPEIGALLMSASTVIVVFNALLLRRASLERV